jgi:RHS repeat-associated protein
VGWSLLISRDLLLQLLTGLGVFTWIALLAWLGVWRAFSEAPATATLVLALTTLLVVPPPAWGLNITVKAHKGKKPRGGGAATTVRTFFRDHLGSAAYITGPNVRQAYEPFGKAILTVTGATDEFTGKEYYGATDMYYFGARWYDAEVGRFASVDPLLTQQENPQQLNAYGYVLNDPVNLTDPTGMCVRPNAACGIYTTLGVRYTINAIGGKGRGFIYDGDNPHFIVSALAKHEAAADEANLAASENGPAGSRETSQSGGTQYADAGNVATDAQRTPGEGPTDFVPADPPFVNVGGVGNLIEVQGDQALRTTVVNNNALGVAVGVTVETKPPSELGPLAVFGGFIRPEGGSVARTVSVLSIHSQTFQVRIDVSGSLKVRVFFQTNQISGPQGPTIGPRR